MHFRIGNHVTKRFRLQHLHAKPVKPQAHAAVRRCAVAESLEQIAEFFFGFFVRKPQQGENTALQFGVGDTNGAAAKFNAVEHQVICLGAHARFVGFKIRQAFVHRRGERVVHRDKFAELFVIFKEREFGNPQQVKPVFRNNVELLRNGLAQRAERGQHMAVVGVRHHKQHVAGFGAGFGKNRLHFGVRHEFRKRRRHAVGVHAHPGKAFRADAADEFG